MPRTRRRQGGMLLLTSVLEVPRHRLDRHPLHPVRVSTVPPLLLLYTRARRHASWTRSTGTSWSIERATYRACCFIETKTVLKKKKKWKWKTRRDGHLLVPVPPNLVGRMDQTSRSAHTTHLVSLNPSPGLRLLRRAWQWVNEEEKSQISRLGAILGQSMGHCLIDAPLQLGFQAR